MAPAPRSKPSSETAAWPPTAWWAGRPGAPWSTPDIGPGDRLLYYRLPMLHGDDVATLQHDLNALGFDAGIVDGIFGADVLRAVLDFQQNRGMAEDGIVGTEVVEELSLMTRATRKMGRQDVKDGSGSGHFPPTSPGSASSWTPSVGTISKPIWPGRQGRLPPPSSANSGPTRSCRGSIDTRPPERNRARQANEVAADMVIGFSLPRTDQPGVFFFQSPMSSSASGQELAHSIATRLGLEAIGRVTPMLRETRATAVVVTVPTLDEGLGAAVARGIQAWLQERAEDKPQSPSSDL